VATVLVVAGILGCAFQATRSARLLSSALWLAGTSALVALLIDMLGAPEVAVIELSVGAGLVTILFVFAINIAGEEPAQTAITIPRPLAWVLVIAVVVLLGGLGLLGAGSQVTVASPAAFAQTFWEDRSLDTLLQLALIFAGVLSVLGLLAEGVAHARKERKP
jgi:uncharacterized MnhB-related membrane protein